MRVANPNSTERPRPEEEAPHDHERSDPENCDDGARGCGGAYLHVGVGGQLALAQTKVPGGFAEFGPNHGTEAPGFGVLTAPVVPQFGIGPVLPGPASPHARTGTAFFPLLNDPRQIRRRFSRRQRRDRRLRGRRLRGRRSRFRRLRLPEHGRRDVRCTRPVRILRRAELWLRHVAAAHAGIRRRGLSRRQSAPRFDRRNGHGSRKSGRSGRRKRRADLIRGAVRRCIRQCGKRPPVTDAAGPIESSDGGPAADRAEAHASAVQEGRSQGHRRGAEAA